MSLDAKHGSQSIRVDVFTAITRSSREGTRGRMPCKNAGTPLCLDSFCLSVAYVSIFDATNTIFRST